MKTNFIKKMATLALSAFAIGSFAQCPTMSGIYVQQGTGTATVAAVMTPSTSAGTGHFLWNITSPSGTGPVYGTPVFGTNNSMETIVFSATGMYTVCAGYTDSTTMCSASSCTVINVTSTVTANCNAAFSSYTDSATCLTHFTNASTGTNLSYKWYKLMGMTLLSTQANPVLNLGSGSHAIALYTYSNGIFCDSTTTSVNVICGTTSGTCNASFSALTNTNTCITQFTNGSTGTSLSYRWYKIPGMTLLSTQANPALSLGNGSHTVILYTYSNNAFCDSTLSVVNVNCNPSSGSCNASFTYSVSPNCAAYFYSTSTGTNLTYQWRNLSAGPGIISTQNSFTTTLPTGNNRIALFVFSNGQFCDSMDVIINCNNSCQANSQFAVFADSVNAGNYFAYNQSTGTGAVSYLWDFGDGTTSTQAYPFHQYATPGQYIICLTVTATNGSVTCTDFSCDSSSVHRISSAFLMNRIQVIQGATAVEENTILKNLSVYPNPVENELTIEVQLAREEKIYYVITDAVGKVVAKDELTSSKTVINTTTLDRGIYFLSVTSNDRVLKTTKLMK